MVVDFSDEQVVILKHILTSLLVGAAEREDKSGSMKGNNRVEKLKELLIKLEADSMIWEKVSSSALKAGRLDWSVEFQKLT